MILPDATPMKGYWSPQTIRIEGEFGRTLYETLAAALPDSLLDTRERAQMAWELADVFRWQADFTTDLRNGGRYTIVFERLRSRAGEVRFGRLMAAELAFGSRSLGAYEYDDANGRTSYFDAEGKSLHRAFLTVPVEFKRISSGFSNARFHPILRQWRRHEGVDYAAAPGSPVMAAGDGVVLRATLAGGYGKLVEVQHAGGIVTRYGHLRGFARGIRPGMHVSQGDCVGFVGATGLATGPHLHFEFRIRGVATDPRLAEADDRDGTVVADQRGFSRQVNFLESQLRHPSSLAVQSGH
jgi:murein DD-endopeptidase MepM/ murein hydrolase activator NlpD